VSYQDDTRYGFGSVVIVNNTETPSPSRSSSIPCDARGVAAVVVGRDCPVNGGIRVFIPSKCVVGVRRYAKSGHFLLTSSPSQTRELRQTDPADRVLRIGGQYVFPQPQPLIEDTVQRPRVAPTFASI
jgi:hypothetical protein